MSSAPPAYVEAFHRSKLHAKADQAVAVMENCTLCPRQCGVNRLAGETGYCKIGAKARVASYNAHFGEEAPLVGTHGSGTIFFSGCNLLCTFCQNYEISHDVEGWEVNDDQLAAMMLELQRSGCHNINFVTPSHVVPQILKALIVAVSHGLHLPLVFNTGGYDQVETLQLLDGIIDIYMPDFKFWDSAISQRTCQAPDYPQIARNALTQMHQQVGDLVIDKNGLAQKGVLVRHLVMPEGLADTREVMRFIAESISANTYVNIMPQYRPCGRTYDVPALNRSLTSQEYQTALQEAREVGILRLDTPRRVFVAW